MIALILQVLGRFFLPWKPALVALATLALSSLAAYAGKPVEVMITGTRIRAQSPCLQTYAKSCAAEGIDVHYVVHPPGMDFTAVTIEEMKKYDVIVFQGVPVAAENCLGTASDAKVFRDNLEKFRQMGGGILWMPTCILDEVNEWNQTIGAEYGATALRERLWDPRNIVNAAPADSPVRRKLWYQYNWTTAISPHPVTEGVRGLLLPINGDWSFPATVPMVFGPGWQVLIHAMSTTRTIPRVGLVDGGATKFDENGKGTYTASPPIAAVREGEGKSGRMMIFPIFHSYTFQNFGNPLMFDALMKNGAEGHPSDGDKLLINAIRWLAEPALAAGGLGTYVAKAKTEVSQQVDRSPIDWHVPMPFDSGSITGDAADGRMYKGLFGARSSYGGGSGTVAEYVAAAKTQGLSFLVFMDEVAKMNDAQYQKLIVDCRRCSDASFAAIPGYSVRDEWGNDYFMTDEKHLPSPTFLNPAGELINFWGMDKQSRTNWGSCLWRMGHWPVHPWYAAKFHILAPYTYEGNKLVDDGFVRYRELQGTPHYCKGVSVSILDSPGEIEGAARQTHLTVVQAKSVDEVRSTIDEDHSYKTSGIYPLYITNGPVIERWAARRQNRGDLPPGGDRFEMELRVSSDAGLREVELIDCNTGRPYRIFRPEGQHEFDCKIDESNTRQFYLIPKITDVNGRSALGSAMTTAQPGNRITCMTDRLMSITYSDAYDPRQEKVVQASGLGMAWTKGKIGAGDLRVVVDGQGARVWGFDGGSIAPGQVNESRKVTTADGTEPVIAEASRQVNNLGSFDVGVIDFIENMQYLTDSKRMAQVVIPGIPVPTKIVDLSMRIYAVRASIGAPTLSRMYEVTIRFKKDTVFKRFDLFSLHRNFPLDPRIWLIKDSAGELVKALARDESFSRSGALAAGDYLCPSNEMTCPDGFINLGTQELEYTANANGADVYVDGKNRPVKAGDAIAIRVLMIGQERATQKEAAWIRNYVTGYGIDGSKPAYDPAVTQGQLLSTDYFMDLKAADGGATFSSKKADLPNRVMVRLEGLPANGAYGRYDLDQKQLRFVPWYEGSVYTSIKPAKSASRLYVGEIFHCSDPSLIISAVQDGADKVLVEIHNPTDQPRTVTIKGAPGFAPLMGVNETLTVGAFDSVKRSWATAEGSLTYVSNEED